MRRRALLATLAVGGSGFGRRSVAAADVVVHVGSALGDQVRNVLYGISSGSFRRAGLTVELQPMNSGAASTAAVIGGALEIGATSLLPLISAHVRGIPIMLVAPGWYQSSNDRRGRLLVRKDAPYRTGRDFNGKTFGVASLSDLRTLIIQYWIDASGGDAKTLKFVELPTSAEVVALEQGRVDAVIAFDPWLSAALASGSVRPVAMSQWADKILVTGFIARTDYVERNPEVVRTFYDALRAATIYARAHEAEMAPLIASFDNQPVADVQKDRYLPLETVLDPREIQPTIDAAFKYGAISRSFPAPELIAEVVRS